MNEKLVLHQFFLPLQRNVKSKCELCNENFSMLKREHICKRCHRSVCQACSPFKVKVYTPDFKNKLHRMCRNCNVQSQFLNKYVQSHQLKFGEDSDIVKLWLKQIGLKHIPKRRISQMKQTKQYTSFMDVWKSLNFSFRQFIGRTIDEANLPSKQIASIINSGLTQFSEKSRDLHHTVYILLFFLAFANITTAVYFTNLILQVLQTSTQHKIENITYFLQELECSEIQTFKMENLIQETSQKIIKRASSNVFTAEITIQIINNLISKRDFEELEKGIAYAYACRKQFICLNSNKPEEVYQDILRNLDSSGFRQGIKNLSSVSQSLSERSSPSRSEKFSQKSYKQNSKAIQTNPKYLELVSENKQLRETIKNQEEKISMMNGEYQKLKRTNSQLSDHHPESPMRKSYDDGYGFWENQDQKDPYSTEQSGDEEIYNSILSKKNQQIAKLKLQVKGLKHTIKEFEQNYTMIHNQETLNSSSKGLGNSSNINSKELKQKDQQISQLQSQNESLKNINKRLLIKMHELSNLLMDKQEKSINQSNKNLDQLVQKYSGINGEQMNKQCAIF